MQPRPPPAPPRRPEALIAAAAAGDSPSLLRALDDPAPEIRAAAYMILARAQEPALPLGALRHLHEKGEAGPLLRRLWQTHSPAIDAFLDELAERPEERRALAAFLGWGSADCVARHVERASEAPCPALWWRLLRNHPSLLVEPLVRHLRGTLGAYRTDAHLAYSKAFQHWLPPFAPPRHPGTALLLLERWHSVLRENGRPPVTWRGSAFERLARVIPEATVDAALRLGVIIEPDALGVLVRSLRADQLLALLATQPESLGDGWAMWLNAPEAFFAAHPEVLDAAIRRQAERPRWLARFLCFLPREREAERLRGFQTWLDAERSPHVELMGRHFATLPPDLRAVELRRAFERRPPPASFTMDSPFLLAYLPTRELAEHLSAPLAGPDLALRARAVDLLFHSMELCWSERPDDLGPPRLVLSALLGQGDQPAQVWCGWLERLRRSPLSLPPPLHEEVAGVVGVVLAHGDRSEALALHLEHWLACLARSSGDFALRQMARLFAAWGGLRPRRWCMYPSWSSLDARWWSFAGRTTWSAAVLRAGGGEALLELARAFAAAGESTSLDALLQLIESEAGALPAPEAWSALLLAQAEREGASPWLRWLLLFARIGGDAAGDDPRAAPRAAIEEALDALPVPQRITTLLTLTPPYREGPTPGDVLWRPLWAALPQASTADAATLAARAYLAAPEPAAAALLGAMRALPVPGRAAALLSFVRACPRSLRGASPHRGALLQALGDALREAGYRGASTLTPALRGRRLRRCLREIAPPG